MKLELRYPATPDNALDHAQLAVEVAWEEFGVDLDYSPASLESVDVQVESLREEGLTGEGAAEALFVLGCYVGEVFVRSLKGVWAQTAQTPLSRVSPVLLVGAQRAPLAAAAAK